VKTVFLVIFFLLIFSSIIAVLFALFSLFRRLRRRTSGRTADSQTRSGNRRGLFSSSKAAEYYADLGQVTDGKLRELFEQGNDFKRKRKFPKAIRTFEKCLYEDVTPIQKAGLLVTVGNCYFAADKLGLAKGHYQKALRLSDDSNGKRVRLACLVNLGLVFAAGGEYNQAIESYRRAIELDRQLNSLQGEAIDRNSLALIYEVSGDLENALKCYNDSLLVFGKLADQEHMEVVKRNIERLEKLIGVRKKPTARGLGN
jgi:tetratricopeptide (TPR) repeat protein